MKTALHYILLAIGSSVASAKLGGGSSVRGLVVAEPHLVCGTCEEDPPDYFTRSCKIYDDDTAQTLRTRAECIFDNCEDCVVDDTFSCSLEPAVTASSTFYATTDGNFRVKCITNALGDRVECTYTQCVGPPPPSGIVCQDGCDASGERQCKARDDSGTILDHTITCGCADCPSDPTFTCTGEFERYPSDLPYGTTTVIGECTVSADKTELHCTEKCVTDSPTKAPTTAPTKAPTKAPTCNQETCGVNNDFLCDCGEVCNETREKVQGQGWVIEKTCGPDCSGVCDGINQVACNEESDCCNWSDKGQGKCQYK